MRWPTSPASSPPASRLEHQRTIITTRPGNGASGVNANQPIVLYTNLPINAGHGQRRHSGGAEQRARFRRSVRCSITATRSNSRPAPMDAGCADPVVDDEHPVRCDLQHADQRCLRLLLCRRQHRHAGAGRANHVAAGLHQSHSDQLDLRHAIQHADQSEHDQRHGRTTSI